MFVNKYRSYISQLTFFATKIFSFLSGCEFFSLISWSSHQTSCARMQLYTFFDFVRLLVCRNSSAKLNRCMVSCLNIFDNDVCQSSLMRFSSNWVWKMAIRLHQVSAYNLRRIVVLVPIALHASLKLNHLHRQICVEMPHVDTQCHLSA